MFMKLILLIIFSLFLCGCTYDEYKMPENAFIKIDNTKIDVFSDNIKLYDLIKDTNVDILTEDFLIDTNKIGEYNTTILYKFEKKNYKYELTYNIVDTAAPVYINAASVRTIIKNQDYYPCDEIVFGDNYDKKPSCKIDGDYDLTTVGSYNVEYIISDSSNNETRKNLKINVVDAISGSSSSNIKQTKLNFQDVITNYKNDNTMIGIDVSRWQTDIDFEKLKNAGVEFVIMRIGINSDIDKDLSMDTYYEKNIKGAKEAGLLVGVYVYTSAIDTKTAKEHAEWVINALNGERLDFPIAFDWENWSKFRKYEISIHDLDEAFNTFADTIEKNGYDAMLYSSKFYLENIWINKKNRPVWLAHYTNKTNYEGNYILWQMSNTGKVDGINGDVDIDIYYKN